MSMFDIQGLHPKLNPFDLGHNHFTTIRMGPVYPISWFECVPGDVFDLRFEVLCRVLPMVAPILNNLTFNIDAYFIPTRLLWSEGKFEKFITTVDNDVIPNTTFEELQPVWMQGDKTKKFKDNINLDYNSDFSLWKYFGLNSLLSGNIKLQDSLVEFLPVDYLRRAYWFIYNEWYRDQQLQPAVDFFNPDTDQSGMDQQKVFYRAWKPDYFSKALTSQQQGVPPSIPISGKASADFSKVPIYSLKIPYNYGGISNKSVKFNGPIKTPIDITQVNTYIDGSYNSNFWVYPSPFAGSNQDAFTDYLNSNNIDPSTFATFNVSDMRDMFAIQRFFESLMRMGTRYIEFLQGQFGVSPSDARLSIPERIGGTSFNISVSEVIQTSETTATGSPQGNQTGHALGVSAGELGGYKVEEFGYIMILVDIQPPAVYSQRLPRELYRKSLLEQYNPHFVNLSYQAINKREVYGTLTSSDNDVFSFAGRYDEMREKQSYISGQLIGNEDDDKVIGGYLNRRVFSTSPAYNSDFIQCKPNTDIFAVENEDQFIVNYYSNVKAYRPLPTISEPGLIDHVYGA